MKIKKLSLIIYLLSLLLVLPGWRNYQANNEILQYSADKTRIPVRSAIVLDKKGTPVCHIDLINHPDLVPNFAKLSNTKTSHPTNEFDQEISSIARQLDLPSCPDQYLNQLRQVAKNNIVLNNNDKSHIHKSAWKYVAGGFAVCALGAGSRHAMTDNEHTSYPTNKGATAAVVGASSAVSSAHFSYQFEQVRKHIRDDWPEDSIERNRKINKLVTKLGRLHGNILFSMATMIGSICYTVTDAVKGVAAIIYKNTESDSE